MNAPAKWVKCTLNTILATQNDAVQRSSLTVSLALSPYKPDISRTC